MIVVEFFFVLKQSYNRQGTPMPASVEQLARSLIEDHGTRAVHIAVDRLNQSIDERDLLGRDFWAQVVHAIHEHQQLVHGLKRRVSGGGHRRTTAPPN